MLQREKRRVQRFGHDLPLLAGAILRRPAGEINLARVTSGGAGFALAFKNLALDTIGADDADAQPIAEAVDEGAPALKRAGVLVRDRPTWRAFNACLAQAPARRLLR